MTEIEINDDYLKMACYAHQQAPLTKKREPTDVRYLKLLVLCIVSCLGISLYAYLVGTTLHFDKYVQSIQFVRRSHNFHYGGSSYTDNYGISHSNVVNDYNTSSNYRKIGSIVFWFSLISAFICILFILLLKSFAKILIYINILLFLTIIFVWTSCIAAYLARNFDAGIFIVLVFFSFLFVSLMFAFLLFEKKISVACGIIKESSKCVVFFPSALLLPLIPYSILLAMFYFATNVLIRLYSFEIYKDGPYYVSYFPFVIVFGIIWIVSYVVGFLQMVVSGIFATWYWTRDKTNVPAFTLMSFTKIIFENHLGTLAFGSLMIILCHLMTALLKLIKFFNRIELTKYLYGSLNNFIKYINYNGYIMCAINGTDFFQSTKDAFNLTIKRTVKVVKLRTLADFLLMLGQFIIIITSTLTVWGCCRINNIYGEATEVLLILVLFSSSVISSLFFAVLKTATDTIFLCALEDYERNDGSAEKPYFMSSKLQQLFIDQ